MMFLKKKYFDFEQVEDRLNIVWNKNALKITEKIILSEIQKISKLVLELKPKVMYVDICSLQAILVDETKKLFLEKMIPAYQNADIKLLAVCTGEDLFKQLFVSHILEEEMKQVNFQAKYFKTKNEAEDWLMSNK
ncbi:MAG: hypothetical protein JXL97_09785 [Bacteroidales bacterium]|nr:hypothetical protein [Bacteroidales bacterium]